ncbi:MAG TPA: phosphate ABC transporter ATP-binding protein [Ramlibacter sp.]|nr:phosphate ABC transporter ATP-binding protein [Ramlibacter sp.]
MSALVQLKSVDVRFGRVAALSGIDLKLARGERLALIGANGSGKSTLLRVLHGLQKPSGGSVLRDSAVRQAMVFQRPHMLRASAAANVALGLWMAGRRWKPALQEAVRALARVGLADSAGRNATSLSGGQQQRLALARAWSLQPDLLLLDEPTASLDPHAKREVEKLMAEFAAAGMTLVFASHNLGQVKRLATRVVYLEQGRVLADLPVQDFFNASLLEQASPEAEVFLKGELA